MEVLSHHLHTEPEPPSQRLGAAVPEALEKLILACLQKDPEQRPGSAAELRRLLQACPGCDQWGQDQAHAWWERWGEKLRQGKGREPLPESSRTQMDIDFKDREGSSRT